MATQLKLKKSSVSGKVPLTSDLEYGELAINYADGKLYFKKSNNTIASFSTGIDTTYVTSIAGLSGTITSEQLLGIVNSVDGSGSGLNADYLDGYTASDFLLASAAQNFITVDDPLVEFTGTISHTGLLLTYGSNIDQIALFTRSLSLTGNWQDVNITGDMLPTGTYLVQMYANDSGSGGTNINEFYSGIMSWYSEITTSSVELPTDEIQLHRAGAGEDGGLYLRTYRTNGGLLKLQMYSNSPNASASNYVFKFRRMI